MGLFNRKKGDVPPDVGQEDAEEGIVAVANSSGNTDDPSFYAESFGRDNPDSLDKKKGLLSSRGVSSGEGMPSIELEKFGAKLESLSTFIHSFQERFSNINERMGELRTSTLRNEKDISKAILESQKAADLVKEVQPEKLRIHYMKLDNKYQMLEEKIVANKEYSRTLMEEIKDLKRKANLFVGTEALLKLNDDVKKDLVEIQKLDSRVRAHSDKTEELFIEMRDRIAESQKLDEKVASIDSLTSNLQKEVQRLGIDYKNFIHRKEFDSFLQSINKEIAQIHTAVKELAALREETERLANVIETILSVAETNKDNITQLAMAIGDNRIEGVGKVEDQMDSILTIIDSLAGQISAINNRLGITDKEKISVEEKKKIVGNEEIHLQNINLHEDLSKSFEKRQEPLAISAATEPDKSFSKPGENTLPVKPVKIAIKEVINSKPLPKRKIMIRDIRPMIKDAEKLLKKKKFIEAERLYKEIQSIYEILPEDKKKQYYRIVLNFYNKLSKR